MPSTNLKLPVHLGDLRGPAGNVFEVIANVKSSIRQLDRAGIPVSDEARAIVSDFMNRSYDETLAMIAEYCDDLDGSLDNLADPSRDEDDDPYFS